MEQADEPVWEEEKGWEGSEARRRVLDLATPVVHDRGGRHGVCVRVCVRRRKEEEEKEEEGKRKG